MNSLLFAPGNGRGVLWYLGGLFVVLSLGFGASKIQANIKSQQGGQPFSPTSTVPIDGCEKWKTLSGKVFMCRGADCASDGKPVKNEVVVVLFDGSKPIQATKTYNQGAYSFDVCTEYDYRSLNRYSIAVDASTFTGGDHDWDDDDLYPEQTWSGKGGECNGTQQNSGAGYCYGGRNTPYTLDGNNTRDRLRIYTSNAKCGDVVIPSPSLLQSCFNLSLAEHVIRPSSRNHTNLDFGFSYDVVTHIDHKGQGSLLNFIGAANRALGTGKMLFVPTVSKNFEGKWWQIEQKDSHPTPMITGNNVVIDGRAMSHLNPATPVTANPQNIRDGITAGVDEQPLDRWLAPDLEIKATDPRQVAIFQMAASNQKITRVALTNGTGSWGTRAAIKVTGACEGCNIEDVIIGRNPISEPTPPFYQGITADTSTNLTVHHNWIYGATDSAIKLSGSGTISDNFIEDNGSHNINSGKKASALSLQSSSTDQQIIINQNHFKGANGFVIDGQTLTKPDKLHIVNNTLQQGGLQSGSNGKEAGGLILEAIDETGNKIEVRGNKFEQNRGPGIVIRSKNNGLSHQAEGNRISHNDFLSNQVIPIDLVPHHNIPPNGQDTNDEKYDDKKPNRGIDHPTIDKITSENGNLVIEGYLMSQIEPGATVEFYRVKGHEYRYSFSRIEGSSQDENKATAIYKSGRETLYQKGFQFTVPANEAGIENDESLAAIVIDGKGNTSEFSPAVKPSPPEAVITLTPGHSKSTAPGLFVHFPHTLTSDSTGSVKLSAGWLAIDGQTEVDWPVTLEQFTCDSADNQGTPINSPLSFKENKKICFRASFFVPAETPQGVRVSLEIKAMVSATGQEPETLSVIDQLTVSDQGSGRLLLKKWVQTQDLDGSVSPKGTDSKAGSGDTLIYTIGFENIGAGPLTSLKIMDNTPAFTQLSEPVVCPGIETLPAGLGSCKPNTLGAANQKGFRGRVIWDFEGELSPGAKGEVSYKLMVE